MRVSGAVAGACARRGVATRPISSAETTNETQSSTTTLSRPSSAMSAPPSGAPIKRVSSTPSELSELAGMSCDSSTSCGMSAPLAGLKNWPIDD
jgi:hypothetical protein